MPHCKMNEVMMDTAGVICQVQPRLNWDFTVSKSWVSTLKARATKFLNKWIGLARAVDPSQTVFTKIRERPRTASHHNHLPQTMGICGMSAPHLT